ncbi:cathelicidin-6-like [Dasypus novemcinctus]|uniref:cathelicidin-6-like n=1 Tax=Dasypus novemcinctus TaxID=9361 RepID=UPI0003288815|nr:cathelicidin-6-like [Dasypus novemcinctus]
MDSVRVAVLLLLLGLSWAEPVPVAKDASLSYTEALAIAVENYNSQSEEENAFRLLEAQPPADWDPALSKPQLLPFAVKETACKKQKNLNLQACPFKDNGQVKSCLGIFKRDEKGFSMAHTCDPEKPTGPVRARRGLRKSFRKLRRKLKKLWPKKNVPLLHGTYRF